MFTPTTSELKQAIVVRLPEVFFSNGGSLTSYQDSYLTELSRSCITAWGEFSGGLLIPVITAIGGHGPSNNRPHAGGQVLTATRLVPTSVFNGTFREFSFERFVSSGGQYTPFLKTYNQALSTAIFRITLAWVQSWSWTGSIQGQPDAGMSGWVEPSKGPSFPGPWTHGGVGEATTDHTLGSGKYNKITQDALYTSTLSFIDRSLIDTSNEIFLGHLRAISHAFAEVFQNWIDGCVWGTDYNSTGVCAPYTGAVTTGMIFSGTVNR